MRILTLFSIIMMIILSSCKQDKDGNNGSASTSKLLENTTKSSTDNPPSKTSFAPGEFDPRISQEELNEMMKYFDERTLGPFQFDPRGFLYMIKTPGSGSQPKLGEMVVVNYEGRLIDDKVFDSTYKTGKPLTYKVGKMIPGFDAAVMLLKPGSKGIFVFPSFLGYENKSVKGPDGKEMIPPKSKLVFDLELVSIK